MRTLPPAEAARVLGNRQRLDLVLGGADWEKVTQATVRPEYRLKRMGEVAQSSAMRLSESEKQEFADWTTRVLSDGYLARHEFKRVGYLPQRVLDDADVVKIGVAGNEIEVSDYLLRHGNRATKDGRGAALPLSVVAELPAKLENAIWTFDPIHKNVCAFFEVEREVDVVGKAVVHFNYARKGKEHNAVITMGIVQRPNINDGGKRTL